MSAPATTSFVGTLLPPRGALRVLSLLAGAYPHGLWRAADVLTGARHLVAVTRLHDDSAAELAARWAGPSEGGLWPVPGGPGLFFVAEPEGEGRPLSYHLGRRHPLAESAGLVAQILDAALATGDTAPLLQPELIRVSSASGRLQVTSIATRCARLLSRTSNEFAEPLWSPSCLSPEGARGVAPTPASVVFSSATLLWWLVHGEPPFGVLPLEEIQRLVTLDLRSLPPLLAHVAPDVDAALRERLFGAPASRLERPVWSQFLTELSQQGVRSSEPPTRADEKWSHFTARRLSTATDFLADGACQSVLLLRSAIEALQAAAFRGAIPEQARAGFRDVASAIVKALSRPVGQTIDVRWRGEHVTMPCGHGPAFSIAAPRFSEMDPSRSWFAASDLTLIWAVATVLRDDAVLDLLGALTLTVERVERNALFTQALLARSAGRSAGALLRDAMQVAPRRLALWGDPAPWIRALEALEPAGGADPVLCRRVERGPQESVLAAIQACAASRKLAFPFPDDDFVDDANAEVDWLTLALLEVARRDGIAEPTTGELLVRWPTTHQAPPDLRRWAAEGARGLTLRLVSRKRGAEHRSDVLELTSEGRMRVTRAGSRRSSGWVGRPRAVGVMRRVAALWGEFGTETAIGREFALRKAAYPRPEVEGPSCLPEVLLVVEADGTTQWWRLPEAPWADGLCEDLSALEHEIAEPETAQLNPSPAPLGLRAEFRLLIDLSTAGGSADVLGALLASTPFSVDELELALEVLRVDQATGRPRAIAASGGEQAISDALVRARARR